MLSLTFLPFLVLMSLSGSLLARRTTSYVQGGSVMEAITLGVGLADVIHNIQKERDMSALYVSVIGPENKNFLLRRYPITDSAVESLSSWPDIPHADTSLNFSSKERFLAFLNRHRYQLDVSQPKAKDELEFYTGITDAFFRFMRESVKEVGQGSTWRHLVALYEIILSKEAFGVERAFGAIFFSRGSFQTQEDYLTFVEHQDIADLTLYEARQYSDIVDRIYKGEVRTDDLLQEDIRRMRYVIRENASGKINASITLGESWFSNMTSYVDILLSIQKQLSDRIEDMREGQRSRQLDRLVTVMTIFLAGVSLCPIVLHGVFRLTSEVQGYTVSLADRTKALSKEKKRTDTLLYQMLPRTVAEQLKKNKEVEAETFSSVTIFFSDVVGYTSLAAKSSPIQVVQMLNCLYMCLDERIQLYDVYKVETIGDAYMVVSGCPKMNGIQHASEIATLAIDILDHINMIEIPHLVGTKYRLRIGVHSGPVVAGVVGTKMPRYCLFGETVNVASKMESTGLPQRIQVSEATHKLLDELGGFIVVPRNDIASQTLMMTSYWLTHREGIVRVGRWVDERHSPLSSDYGDRFLYENEEGMKKWPRGIELSTPGETSSI